MATYHVTKGVSHSTLSKVKPGEQREIVAVLQSSSPSAPATLRTIFTVSEVSNTNRPRAGKVVIVSGSVVVIGSRTPLARMKQYERYSKDVILEVDEI